MLVVRPMAAGDVAPTAALFQEMQAHYRVACPPIEEIEAKLKDLPEGVTMLVAADPDIIGFAALGAIFPGLGLRAGLFLKELFVASRARKGGVGTALMRAAARFATENGFSRLDWTADSREERLLRFYEAQGAVKQAEKVFFRLTGSALEELAALNPDEIS